MIFQTARCSKRFQELVRIFSTSSPRYPLLGYLHFQWIEDQKQLTKLLTIEVKRTEALQTWYLVPTIGVI